MQHTATPMHNSLASPYISLLRFNIVPYTDQVWREETIDMLVQANSLCTFRSLRRYYLSVFIRVVCSDMNLRAGRSPASRTVAITL